ncbi:MAG: hypothetical protein ACI9XU_001961 [Arenicella sp.]|jgi:hypothetical protein
MRNYFRPVVSSFLVLILLAIVKPIYGATDSPHEDPILPRPSAELQPGDVVQIVIDALSNNDYPFPDAGIETTFNFASPSNKVQTGPLQKFTQLLKGPVFNQMINHRDSTLSDLILDENKALRLVQIISENNKTLYFAFRLGLQQKGDYAGMWLTEAVWPLEGPNGDVLAL